MFQEFYGFTRVPFSRTIATQDLFPTAGQKELNARLAYLVRERGLGLVTGDIGSGKSTAVRTFAASLDFNRYLVVYLANPTTGMTGLYRDLVVSLGYEPPFSKPRLVTRIRTALEEVNVTKHRAPVVVLDEAHLLTQPMLEQMRLLFSDKMREAVSPWRPWSCWAIPTCGGPCICRCMKRSINGSPCVITWDHWICRKPSATSSIRSASRVTRLEHSLPMTRSNASSNTPKGFLAGSTRSVPPRSWRG
jgi:hypothetical protein